MNAKDFARKRAKIDLSKRRGWWQRRAMKNLLREAVAVPVVIDCKVIGWRIGSGEVVCLKRRYATAERADSELHSITEHSVEVRKIPVRVYHCPHCRGFHLTSKINHEPKTS